MGLEGARHDQGHFLLRGGSTSGGSSEQNHPSFPQDAHCQSLSIRWLRVRAPLALKGLLAHCQEPFSFLTTAGYCPELPRFALLLLGVRLTRS